MQPGPRNFPRISAELLYQDADAAIEWLCRAFGFEVRLKVAGEDGLVQHSELTFGEAVVMISDERARAAQGRSFQKSPRSLGGATTQSLAVYVEDIDAHFARAQAAGARIESEPEVHDHGADYWCDKSYGCLDLDGHQWWFSQRLRSAGE